MKHDKHFFKKESIAIEEMNISLGYQSHNIIPRKVTIYKCSCGERDVFYKEPADMDMVLDSYTRGGEET